MKHRSHHIWHLIRKQSPRMAPLWCGKDRQSCGCIRKSIQKRQPTLACAGEEPPRKVLAEGQSRKASISQLGQRHIPPIQQTESSHHHREVSAIDAQGLQMKSFHSSDLAYGHRQKNPVSLWSIGNSTENSQSDEDAHR